MLIRKLPATLFLLIALLCLHPGADASGLPIISIRTEDGSSAFITDFVREDKLNGRIDYVPATVSVSQAPGMEISDAPAQVKVRGNWTLDYPKKSIRIKFEEKQSMLGLNDGRTYRSWVLLADWKDLSMTHNPAGLYLAGQILGTDGYYCADHRSVEVYVNSEYWGLYLLTEQQEVNPGRVAITEPARDSADTAIGYLFEYDAYFNEEKLLPRSAPTFEVYHTGLGGEQQGYTIASTITDRRQRSFLRTYVRLAYRICHSAITEGTHYAFNADFTDIEPLPDSTVQETVARVIDLRSLVDTYVLQEIVCNPDLGWSSFYLSVDFGPGSNHLLTFQAPWDFDSCFGIRAGYEACEGLYAASSGNPWLNLIAPQPWFQELAAARWADLQRSGLPQATLELIRLRRDALADAFARNYARWPSRIAEGNHELVDELNACQSQAEAADYLLRWLAARFAWLDMQWQPSVH